MKSQRIEETVKGMMPEVIKDLSVLVGYPSIAFPGYPSEPVYRMAEATMDLLHRYGVPNVRQIEIPGGYPLVYGEILAPPGAPTVLMYAHYDVQPAKKEGWNTEPWEGVVKGGRLYGRGAADDKSGILINAASIRCFSGPLPVGVKVVIEGEEETTGHLPAFIQSHPDLFQCDLFIVTDNGNLTIGEPVLTTTLRGEVSCRVGVATLDHPVHSGSFGGAAPDALVALIRMLATLHNAKGEVEIRGLRTGPPPVTEFPETLFREMAGVREGVELIGSGALSERLWSKPSASVIGINAPSVKEASNILIPAATAAVSMRIAPGADPDLELRLLMDRLRDAAPWNVQVEIQKVSASPGFVCPTHGPGFAAARSALEHAFHRPAREIGAGGSIPLLEVLRQTVPHAEFILWGCADLALSRIHGTNESVDIGELEHMIVAQGLLLQDLGHPGRR
ncbi:MAG: M20/M25/M40 family metallo-hydrolase [Methanomicrobiales archaeon]|nr:M20/M25/M40 family metallo-hydrolase [Methanomicrobiales archaeon]